MGDPELPALVKKAQKGERPAFEALVHRTARLVYAHIVAMVRDRQRAEDLAQETFLAAWKSIATVTDPHGFTSWLLTLAHHTTLDDCRSRQRQKRRAPPGIGISESDTADPASPLAEAFERAEAQQRALQMLQDLPADYREPLMLRYLAGADYETIRGQLNLTDGALRGLLHRGMAMLRERMSQQEQ